LDPIAVLFPGKGVQQSMLDASVSLRASAGSRHVSGSVSGQADYTQTKIATMLAVFLLSRRYQRTTKQSLASPQEGPLTASGITLFGTGHFLAGIVGLA